MTEDVDGTGYWREVFAGAVNPTRALNRFTQGKMCRITPYDVYQQEPLNVTLSVGAHRVNENNKFGTAHKCDCEFAIGLWRSV